MMGKLAAMKEKLLFALAALLTVGFVLQAPLLGGGIDEIRVEQRQSAMAQTGIDETAAKAVEEQLDDPQSSAPAPVDASVLDLWFFDEVDVYKPGKGSVMARSTRELEGLPPLALVYPVSPRPADFAVLAGPHPVLWRALSPTPRDTRPVDLSTEDAGEFDD